MRSLCAPTPELSCFGCCPPIRPAYYDPLDYAGSLRREFLDNRTHFLTGSPSFRPVIGYYCWALGFLDKHGRKVGCLLHPQQNQGQDLRWLINYGSKCGREECYAARMFALLTPEGQEFWLPLVQGMNSFYFSSPRSNPLFHLLVWGPMVLETLRRWAERKSWTATELLCEQPFLLGTSWTPKAHRFLFRLGLESFHLENTELDGFCRKLLKSILLLPEAQNLPTIDICTMYIHKLPLEADLLDFLRLGLGWQRASLQQVVAFKKRIKQLANEVV